jgi:hypothetical protein
VPKHGLEESLSAWFSLAHPHGGLGETALPFPLGNSRMNLF